MKKLVVLLAVSLFSSGALYSQLTFSVSPGLSFNSATFGYKVGNFVPFVGIQHLGSNFNVVTEFKEFDFDLGTIVDESISLGVKANVFMPNIGTKYFFISQDNLKAFGAVNVAVPFLSSRLDLDDDDFEDDINEAISQIRIIAGELSVGAEYFFSDQFSLGGEFGLRLINLSYNQSFDDSVFNPNTGEFVPTTTTVDGSLTVSPTFSRVSLNFYLGGNSDN